METKKWICTDIDAKQYGRKLRDKVYEFKQKTEYPDGFIADEQDVIDLTDYTEEEINSHLSPYGWSIEQLREENTTEDAEWLMAECIFEQTI